MWCASPAGANSTRFFDSMERRLNSAFVVFGLALFCLIGYNTTRIKDQEVIFMAAKIEKSTIIGDVLDIAPQTAPLFMAIGMHCLGCPSSRGETVEEACMVHGVDADAFLEQVNRFIEASEAAGL